MLLAATLAALAMNSGRLGAVHGLAFILESQFHLGHAAAISIMLSHVMDYNKIGNVKKHAQIAKAMGEKVDGLSERDAAERSVICVRTLLETICISTRLPNYGVLTEQLPVIKMEG